MLNSFTFGRRNGPESPDSDRSSSPKRKMRLPGRGCYDWLKRNQKFRDFVIYVIFVVLFTVVTFASKPGEVQFFLNDFHKSNLAVGIDGVRSVQEMYNWFEGPFADKMFPYTDPATGEYLDSLQRLYISGEHARVMGGIRLRHARSTMKPCVVPSFLQSVNGRVTQCAQEYSWLTRKKTPIYGEGSPQLEGLSNTNYTLSFEYKKPSEINTTVLFGQRGRFATYGQDGYNLDVVPNVAPNILAKYVSWCRPSMIEAITNCRLSQGMGPYDPVAAALAAAATPTPTPTFGPLRRRLAQDGSGQQPQMCTEDEDIEPMLVGVDTNQCRFEPDEQGVCQLPYVGFHLMRELMRLAPDEAVEDPDEVDVACRGCMCQGDKQPACVQSCSPKLLFKRQLRKLRDANWVDEEATRAVFADVSLFNQNFNLFTTFRAFFEMPPMGGVQGLPEVQTFKLHRFVTTADAVMVGLQLVFYAFVVFFTVQEIREVFKERLLYFKNVWNILDWANLIILYIVLGMQLGTLLMTTGFSFTSATIKYVDFITVANFSTQELNVSALNFFLLYFKIFKYLREVPRMDAILVTISGAATDLCLFMLMASLVLIGFSAAFYVAFGMTVHGYRSIGNSFGSLIQALLGAFDYNELEYANPVMAPILFYLYFLVAFFVLLSMFIAILDDSYGLAKETQANGDMNFYGNLYKKTVKRITGWMGKKQAAQNLLQDLLNADSDGTVDGLLDEEELEEVMRKNPKAGALLETTSVKELIAKYDTNNDGVLDRGELMEMIDKLLADTGMNEDDMKGDEDSSKDKLPPGIAMLQQDVVIVQDKVVRVDTQLKDLSRNTTKKLGLMIDLMMSLSDQISSAGQGIQTIVPVPAQSGNRHVGM